MSDGPGEAYFLNNYGSCDLGPKCECLKSGWFEVMCSHWTPSGAKSVDELIAQLKEHKYGLDSQSDGHSGEHPQETHEDVPDDS